MRPGKDLACRLDDLIWWCDRASLQFPTCTYRPFFESPTPVAILVPLQALLQFQARFLALLIGHRRWTNRVLQKLALNLVDFA